MKHLLLWPLACIIFFIITPKLYSQSGFNFQAALRESNGFPIADSSFVLSVNIVKDHISGTTVYSEKHLAKTNKLGLFNIIIGQGDSNDDFQAINWGTGPYFIELKINGNTFSTSPLLSVPYAMHAYSATQITGLTQAAEKTYTDSLFNAAIDIAQNPGTPLKQNDPSTKGYVDSLLEANKDIDVSISGDTLVAGLDKLIIPGISALNQNPYPQQRCFGGSANDRILRTLELDSGHTIIVAETFSHNGDITAYFGQSDLWIFEVDASFNILWQTMLGGSSYEHCSVLKKHPNGNLILAGTTESNSGSFSKNQGKFDVWIAELDKKSHETIWIESYGGSQTEFLNDVLILEDESLIMAGSTFSEDGDIPSNKGVSDLWLLKIDKLKTILWNKTYGENRFEALHSIIKKPDGHLVLLGETESNSGTIKGNHGGLDILVLEVDQNGEILNQVCLGTENNEELTNQVYHNESISLAGITFNSEWNQANSIVQQNIILATITDNLEGIKLNTFGGSQSEWPVQLLQQNTVNIILNTSSSNDGDVNLNYGDSDFWIVETANNKLTHQYSFGGSYAEKAQLIKPIEGGYIIAGTAESSDGLLTNNNGNTDIWILKTDEQFNLVKQQNFGGTESESLFDISYVNNTITIYGATSSNDYGINNFHGQAGKNEDIWILRTPF